MSPRTLRRRATLTSLFFFFNDTATTEIYTLSLHDALPILQHLPGGLHGGGAAVRSARAEARQVEVCGGAACRGGREIALQPLQLRRRGADVDLRIERHHVPGAEVVAVVALPSRAGGVPEIAEIGGSPGGVVVMDPGCGPGARLETTPGRGVAVCEVAGRAAGIDVVAGREHRPLDPVQQGRRGFVSSR